MTNKFSKTILSKLSKLNEGIGVSQDFEDIIAQLKKPSGGFIGGYAFTVREMEELEKTEIKVIKGVKFESCSFESLKLDTIQDCQFSSCKFTVGNAGDFSVAVDVIGMNTRFNDCVFEKGEFSAKRIATTKFEGCEFNSVSFGSPEERGADYDEVDFEYNKFIDTTSFININFGRKVNFKSNTTSLLTDHKLFKDCKTKSASVSFGELDTDGVQTFKQLSQQQRQQKLQQNQKVEGQGQNIKQALEDFKQNLQKTPVRKLNQSGSVPEEVKQDFYNWYYEDYNDAVDDLSIEDMEFEKESMNEFKVEVDDGSEFLLFTDEDTARAAAFERFKDLWDDIGPDAINWNNFGDKWNYISEDFKQGIYDWVREDLEYSFEQDYPDEIEQNPDFAFEKAEEELENYYPQNIDEFVIDRYGQDFLDQYLEDNLRKEDWEIDDIFDEVVKWDGIGSQLSSYDGVEHIYVRDGKTVLYIYQVA